MLAYILALGVGLGSFALYMAAFFFPEVHRKSDFIWSGIGLFYALVLWVCAGRITGGVLLGQTASVALLGWFGWQTLKLRWDQAPGQKTQLPSNLNVDGLREKLTNLTSSEGLSEAKEQATRLFSTVKDKVQGSGATSAGTEPTATEKPAASGASNPLAAVTGLADTAKQAIAKVTQLGKKPSRPTIVLNHPPKDAEVVDTPATVEAAAEDDFDDIETPPATTVTTEPAIASASTTVEVDDDDRTELLPPREPVTFTTSADAIPAEEEAILNNTVPVAPEVAEQLEQPTEFTASGQVADSTSVAEPEPVAETPAVSSEPESIGIVENPLGEEFVPAEPIVVDAAEMELAPPAEPIGAGDPRERQLEEADVNAPPIEPTMHTQVDPEVVEEAIAASENDAGVTPELKAPNPFFDHKNSESSGNPEA